MLAKVLRGLENNSRASEWYVPSDDGSPVQTATAASNETQTDTGVLRAEITRLKLEVQQAAQEAFERGKTEGDRLARQAVDQQLEGELSKLRQLMAELKATGPRLRQQAEEELVRLSIAVARRVIHRELTIDSEALAGLIKAAFDKLDRRQIDQVRTDPKSGEAVRRVVHRLGLPASVRVVEDPALRPGSLLIDFPQGQLDASVETQLAEIERGFVDIVRHS